MENIKLYLRDKVNIDLLPKKYNVLLDTEFTSVEQLNSLIKEYMIPIQKKI